mmetsp:Transcript_59574/g.98769  ORF Transcript_59574/g.98769 Transcript_59574/m.98769 type:complete len:434 (+) Transcript_59574:6136-7437(+)
MFTSNAEKQRRTICRGHSRGGIGTTKSQIPCLGQQFGEAEGGVDAQADDRHVDVEDFIGMRAKGHIKPAGQSGRRRGNALHGWQWLLVGGHPHLLKIHHIGLSCRGVEARAMERNIRQASATHSCDTCRRVGRPWAMHAARNSSESRSLESDTKCFSKGRVPRGGILAEAGVQSDHRIHTNGPMSALKGNGPHVHLAQHLVVTDTSDSVALRDRAEVSGDEIQDVDLVTVLERISGNIPRCLRSIEEEAWQSPTVSKSTTRDRDGRRVHAINGDQPILPSIVVDAVHRVHRQLRSLLARARDPRDDRRLYFHPHPVLLLDRSREGESGAHRKDGAGFRTNLRIRATVAEEIHEFDFNGRGSDVERDLRFVKGAIDDRDAFTISLEIKPQVAVQLLVHGQLGDNCCLCNHQLCNLCRIIDRCQIVLVVHQAVGD